MQNNNLWQPQLATGTRLNAVKGFDAAEKYPTPKDSVVPIFDEDADYVYIKTTDVNGGVSMRMFSMKEEPIPKFDPKKYVTIDDFNSFREEMRNGFNAIHQSINNTVAANSERSDSHTNNKNNIK